MRVLGDVRDVLAGVLADVEAIATSPAVMRELLADLQRAESMLAKRLRDEATKHGTLDTRFTGAQALMVQHQANIAIEYVQARLAGHTKDQAAKAIDAGLKRTVTTMEGLEQRFSGIVSPLRLREAHEMSAAKQQASGMWARQFPTSVDRYGTKMLGELEEIMRAGLIAGSSMDDIIAAVTGHGGPKGRVSMAAKVTPNGVLRTHESDIPEGLFVRHKYWAERIVRTEMLKAYNGARQTGLESMSKDHPGLKRKILAILDKRTAKDSIAVHGQIRAIKEHFVDGAGRSYLFPPARPNDRETVIPWKDEWDDSSSNMSEWEKVCIGEGDAATEAKLEAAMRAIASGTKTPKPHKGGGGGGGGGGDGGGGGATLPMDKPRALTWAQKVEQDMRGRIGHVSSYGAMVVDGTNVGGISPPPRGGMWKAYNRLRDGIKEIGEYATEGEARVAVESAWHERAAKAAKGIERWKMADYEKAVDAKDYPKMRRMVRGILYENGVMPRDALFSDAANDPAMMFTVQPKRSMPDARAQRYFVGGKIEMRQDVFEEAQPSTGTTRRVGIDRHIRTMIHEELHGATKIQSTGFYAGYGAAIEEVTVEMAARKLQAKVTKTAPEWYHGSYQPQIEQIVRIVQEEVAKVNLGQHRGVTDREAIADAGVKMRARKAPERLASGALSTKETSYNTPQNILDSFLKHLKVPAKAKKGIRKRIVADVKAPR